MPLEKGGNENCENDLVVEEYKSCRDLIARNIDIIEKNELYVVGAVAVTAVYAISTTEKFVAIAAAVLTLLLAVLGYLRYEGLDKTIHIINDYFIGLECRYSKLGYTKFYRMHKKASLRGSRLAVWWTLIGFCIFFLFFMLGNAPISKPNKPATGASTQNY